MKKKLFTMLLCCFLFAVPALLAQEDARFGVLSPDGKRFAIAHQEDLFWILDVEKIGSPDFEDIIVIFIHEGDEAVLAAAFSPDGTKIVAGYDDGTLKLWDTATGEEISGFGGHEDYIRAVAFSPDGKQVVSGSDDKTVKLWDAATGKEIRTFSGHEDYVRAVAFSPNGRQIVSGSDDKTVKLWDAATGKEIRTFSGHEDWVMTVAFSPDGKQIVSGSDDETLKLWNAVTGRLIRTLSGQNSFIHTATFSPNGRLVVSGSFDGTVKLWDAVIGRAIKSFTLLTRDDDYEWEQNNYVSLVSFFPDGKRIFAYGNRGFGVWDIASGNFLNSFKF